MYDILSNLPVAYTCANCTEKQPAEWKTALKNKLQSSVHQVLTALLNSRTSTHLLRYRQVSPPVQCQEKAKGKVLVLGSCSLFSM